MADETDKSQQTEEPTAKRLEQARESGAVSAPSEPVMLDEAPENASG